MTKLQEKIVDAITGEITMRDFTAEEILAVETLNAELAEKLAHHESEKLAKETARAAILTKLGITSDEAKILLS